jgi:hypothetical protein
MRAVLKRVLILCEDKKSSLLYLKSFKYDEEFRRKLTSVDIEIYQPKNFSPMGLVSEAKIKKKKAKRDRNSYDQVWIVLDKDQHLKIPEALSQARESKINYVLSIVCFEYWILLHFVQTTKAFYNCSELIKYITDKYYPIYDKKTNCFYDLKDKLPTALLNGQWLQKQVADDFARGVKVYELSAYTNMHELVKVLLSQN